MSPALPVQPGAWRIPLICPWRTRGTRALRRPQLFFKCLLCPQNGRPPKNPSWTHGPNDIKACLVFFSAFEELKLQATGRLSGPWIMPPQSSTSRPPLRSCTLPPDILCLDRCHSFPVSCKAILLLPYLTSCCTSRPAHFCTVSLTQQL